MTKYSSAALAIFLCAGVVAAEPVHDVEWGYAGDIGPAQWAALDPAFAACAHGTEQSPIDLADAVTDDHPAIAFDYVPRSAEIVNNGHTIEVNVDWGSGIIVGDIRYELLQFHFHRGSEHTVAGVRFPLEMHLVHRSDDGALAVVGVLFRESAASETLAPIWKLLPLEPGDEVPVPGTVDLAALLPESRPDVALRRFAHHAPLHRGRILGGRDRTDDAVGSTDRDVRGDLRRQLPARTTAQRSPPGPRRLGAVTV